MSLLDKAKKTAKEADDQKKKEAASEASFRKSLAESLEKISKGVLAGLREFNGVETKHGTLKLIKKRVERGPNIATLRLTNRKAGYDDIDILYIDAAIESGERDYSDDCRNVPYTEAIVSMYVKKTSSDSWPYGPSHYNLAVKGLGLSDFFGEYVHNWNDDELPKKLEKVAAWLAPLFRE